MTAIHEVSTTSELQACFSLMRELRPQIENDTEFVQQVERQALQGYKILAQFEGSLAVGLAGYKICENFVYGRFAYLDDLVVATAFRKLGLGQSLVKAVATAAAIANCRRLVLDTNLGNEGARAFYKMIGLEFVGAHFMSKLEDLSA